MAKSGMTKHRKATSVAITALLLGLGGCNMYVIDFENKLPDGSVLAPKAEMKPPEPVDPITGSDAVAFMDSTTAQLEGCRVITRMRISHDGTFDEGDAECLGAPDESDDRSGVGARRRLEHCIIF